MTSLDANTIKIVDSIMETLPKRILSKQDMAHLFSQTSSELSHRGKKIQGLSNNKFIEMLLKQEVFKAVPLKSPYSNVPVRYSYGDISLYELALSINRLSYLCHGTAAFLHGLTKKEPPTIYINREQTPKARSETQLSQEGLDMAFSRPQRRSQFVLRYRQSKITLLSGKHSNRLGVQQIQGEGKMQLDITGLERTLIDITVRPGYAGGVSNVLECFRAAREKLDSKELTRILRALDYVYPYHQALGYYLQKAGFQADSWTELRSQGLHYDFYLEHGMKKKKYDSYWRIFCPSSLGL